MYENRDFVSPRLSHVRRMVVKVGTNLLRGGQEGLNLDFMEALASQIFSIQEAGVDVILVSSGAVGAGAFVFGAEQPPTDTSVRQALAALGQSRLMHHYKLIFGRFGVKVAQVLLTRDSLDDRKRYLNIRNTLETLLSWKVLPIINENDTVAIEELKFGDNDQLSALIAGKMGADLLVILTDVKGMYDRPPQQEGARRIARLYLEEQDAIDIGEGTASSFGLGGMRSKLEAAQLATRTGILTFIGPGREPGILKRVLAGEDVGTWCEPRERMPARKRWLAMGKRPGSGLIRVDSGAEAALLTGGSSLLPSGVVSVEGTFREGDLIRVYTAESEEIAMGLIRYSSAELEEVRGMKTPEVQAHLGDRQNYEVIHRDDMVVVKKGQSNEW